MDFSKFDEQINKEQLQKDIADAANNQEFEETPAGTYTVKIENMEVGETKDHRPMFKVMCRITEGEMKKRCLFMNRVLYGTKNDGNMIASVIGWLQKLEPQTVGPVVFESYSQFAELVLDIFEEVEEAIELEVDYDADKFNSITINDVFELE